MLAIAANLLSYTALRLSYSSEPMIRSSAVMSQQNKVQLE